MKKMMAFEKMAKEKKSDKGMKEGSKADMLKDKMMMKKKMASGGMAPVKAQMLSPRGAMTGGPKTMGGPKPVGKPAGAMGSGPSLSPRGAMTGGGKPMGAMGGIKKGYRKGGMCK